jgi:aquaporin NIP
VGRDLRPEAAEALGTFFLLLVGGTALLSGQPAWLVAAAFGGVILVLVYALGPLSGAHFNPAITVAFAVTRHFPWRRVASYVAAQLAGAVLAVLLLRAWRP